MDLTKPNNYLVEGFGPFTSHDCSHSVLGLAQLVNVPPGLGWSSALVPLCSATSKRAQPALLQTSYHLPELSSIFEGLKDYQKH